MITAVLFANPASVDKNSSQKVAENIFKQFSETKNLADFNVDRVDIIKSDSGQNLLYVYNLNPTGFIIVAGSNRSLPCLAYSFESDFSLEPIAVQKLIGSYKEEINEQLNNIQPVRQDIQENWDKYLSANPSYPELRDVQPLLNCTFAQSGNWNNGVTDAIGFNGPVG